MKQIITSIATVGVLLKVLFNTDNLMTRIVVIPFLVFAVALGLKNTLIIMNQKVLAIKEKITFEIAGVSLILV